MNARFSLVVAAACAALSPAALGAVSVTFENPERYTDVGILDREGPRAMKALEAHLQALGAAHLPPGHDLRIAVLDIDLAGEDHFRPGSGSEVRIARGGADWPRIRLRYTLVADGKQFDSREETVSEPNYLRQPFTTKNEAYSHEKRMLEKWFRGRFAGRAGS